MTNSCDDTPPNGTVIGERENQAMLAFIGNSTLQIRQNTLALRAFRAEIEKLNRRYDIGLASRLVGEYERHHKTDTENVEALEAIAAKAG